MLLIILDALFFFACATWAIVFAFDAKWWPAAILSLFALLTLIAVIDCYKVLLEERAARNDKGKNAPPHNI